MSPFSAQPTHCSDFGSKLFQQSRFRFAPFWTGRFPSRLERDPPRELTEVAHSGGPLVCAGDTCKEKIDEANLDHWNGSSRGSVFCSCGKRPERQCSRSQYQVHDPECGPSADTSH